MELAGVSVIEGSQPKGVKPRIIERKLRSGVNRQDAVKQKRRKKKSQANLKQIMPTQFLCIT